MAKAPVNPNVDYDGTEDDVFAVELAYAEAGDDDEPFVPELPVGVPTHVPRG